ncbi:MAG: hypothetical protein AABY18_01240 [Candidatus Thermoplasmatota archaeon]
MLERLANFPNAHRTALQAVLPDDEHGRDIIFNVARVDQCAFNQDQLVTWIVRVRSVGRTRPRPGGKHPTKAWKAARRVDISLSNLAKNVERLTHYFIWLGARRYRPNLGPLTDDLVHGYLNHRKKGTDPRPGALVVDSCNPHLGLKARNLFRQAFHHLVRDLDGAAAADKLCPWKMEKGQPTQGAKTWAARPAIDDVVQEYGDDEYGLVIRLCRAGFSPNVALTRKRDDFRFDGARLHVRTEKGWFSNPADPAPFARRVAAMLDNGDEGYLVRGPGGEGHATDRQHIDWCSRRELTGVPLGKISKWGSANLLMLGYTALYVAKLRGSSESTMFYLHRDASGDPGDFETVDELRRSGAYGFRRCQSCNMVQAANGDRFQRCVSCHVTLNGKPLDIGFAHLLDLANRHERYTKAANRSLGEDAKRLLDLLGWQMPGANP